MDTVTLTGNNNVVNATLDNALTATGAPAALTTATLGGADSISGTGTGNSLVITDGSAASVDAIPVGASISGVQTITLKTAGNAGNTVTGTGSATVPAGAHTFDVSGIAGLTAVNVTSSGALGDNIKAATTTNITVTALNGADAVTTAGGKAVSVTSGANVTVAGEAGAVTVTNAQGGATQNTISIQDGAAVTVNATGLNGTASTISVGAANHAPTGAVAINETGAFATTGTADAVNVTGGTTVAVTENLTVSAAAAAAVAASAAAGPTITGGAVTINGTSSTTSVSVTQTAEVQATTGTAAVLAGAGTPAAAAAPGLQATAAIPGTPAKALVAGTSGVVDGSVSITDTNGTITSVALTNSGASTFSGNALANLSLTGTSGGITITDAAAVNTTLNLTLNSVKAGYTQASDSIVDASNQIKVLNVTTAGGDSTVTSITDTALKTLNVSGTNALNLGSVNSDTSLSTVAISGSASFSDGGSLTTGLASLGATLTSFTTTSSGKITAALDDTTQTFVGSTGQDVITINATADATKAITAGSASNNELILDGGAYGLTSATAKLVTGFQTVGVTGAVTGIIDMSVLDAKASALDIIGNSNVAFTKVATGASISLDANSTAVSVSYADTNGAGDTTSVTFGAAANKTALTATSLTLADANGNGVGTVNLVSNEAAAGGFNTITTLVDNGLANLNVSGTGGLTIGTLNEASTQATSFTLNNTAAGTAGVTITSFTDTHLGNLSFAGTGNSTIGALSDSATAMTVANTGSGSATIGTLTDNLASLTFTGTGAVKVTSLVDTAASLSLSNTGTGAASIGAINDVNGGAHSLTSLTLTGNVALGSNTLNLDAASGLASGVNNTTAGVAYAPTATAIGVTTGFTLSGATDNAHVNVNLAGAAATYTDTITLGNGNNYVTDGSSAGKVNITVGTGSNLIDLSTGSASTYAATVTLGAHTGVDSVLVGVVAANAVAPNTVINGALKGDYITFNDVTAAGTTTPTTSALAGAGQVAASLQTSITAATSLAAAIALADTNLAAHSATAFQYGGNTYVIENHSAAAGTGTLTAGDAVVQLTGLHTIGSTITNGHIVLTA